MELQFYWIVQCFERKAVTETGTVKFQMKS